MKKTQLIFAAALAAFLSISAQASTTTIIPPGDTPVCPAQAQAAGYTSLVFDDEFTTSTTVTTSGSATSGYNWYPNYWAGASAADVSVNTGTVYSVNGNLTSSAPASPTAAQTATGVLSVIGGGNLGSVPEYPNVTGMGTHPALAGSFQHCYYEARIQMNSQSVSSENAFWSWSTSQFYNSSVKSSYVDTAENDFMEWVPDTDTVNGTTYHFYACNTMHDWYGSTDESNTNASNVMDSITGITQTPAQAMGDGNFHIYGCLWVQLTATTGYTEYYLDNHLIVHAKGVTRFLTGVGTGTSSGSVTTVNGVVCYTAPGNGLTSQEASHMYMIIGGETGWPINVDWVHVWQGSGGAAGSGTGLTAQTLSSFPSTLSLSTTQSPYTLPSTTSAGLTVTYTVASGPATVSGHTLTLTGAGTVVLDASQAGNSTYAAYSGTETITVTAPSASGPQTLSGFPSTLDLTMAQTPYTLPSKTSAGLTVTYTRVSGPATVSGDTLTLTGAGTVVLNASQAGNSSYTAFAATETISVSTVAQTVSDFPSTLSLPMSQAAYSLPATTSAGLTLTYSVASGPGSVSGHSLTLGGTGTIVIHATQAGNATYSAYAGTETITVAALATQTVSNFPSTLSLATTASPYALPATTSAGLTLSYTVVSGPATVSGHTLTLTGAGTVVLTASQAGNSSYASYSGEEAITVTTATQTVSNFPSTLSLSTAQSPYALPSVTSAGLSLSYSVASGPATVSGHSLTLTGAGTVVLHATQAGNATYGAYSGWETITVTAPTSVAQTLSNFPSAVTVSAGSGPIALPAKTSAGLTVTYTVLSGSATVSGDTLSLGSGTGTVIVKATQAGNATYAAFSATETITIVTGAGSSQTFAEWESSSFNSSQLASSTVSGATATPMNDGVPNLLKYVYDINPAAPMSASDFSAMSSTDVDTTTTPGTTYLTLTYRSNPRATGVTVQVQTSTDLQTWSTVTPSITRQVGTDSATGDPIVEDEVNTQGASTEFIRLNVTSP
jgi:hypothetical protein